MISSLSSSSFIPNQGRDNLTRDSFRAQLIFRIVASIKYFLSVGDLSRVEKGLVTLLRIIGYISGDFVHLLFSYFQMKFPSNYAVTASYLYTLKPRFTQFFETSLLDTELLFCAFNQRSPAGINQMLLRLESNESLQLSIIRVICAMGISGILSPSRNQLVIEVLKEQRMLAELASVSELVGQDVLDSFSSSFTDFESFNLLEAPWSQIKKFVFFPGLLDDYTKMVSDLFSSGAHQNMPAEFVLERVAILTCLRIFNCPVDDLPCLLQNLYNELFYLRISVRGIPLSASNTNTHRVINQLDLFNQPWHPILQNIRLLLE